MNTFWIVSAGIVAVNAFLNNENYNRFNDKNGWFEEERRAQHLEETDLIKMILYTNSGPTDGEEITASDESIENSSFNPNDPVRFYIHGWLQNRNTKFIEYPKDAFLSVGNYNCILVMWEYAMDVFYNVAVDAVPRVGKNLANIIDYLVANRGIPRHSITVIGHSLGAHVAGYAGKYVKSGRLVKIVALDPAAPLYSYNDPKTRLSSTDALYVESIQTNVGQLGFEEPLGHATFYPNGGDDQPDCMVHVIGICSHQLSVYYYAASIRNNGSCAIRCDNYENALAKDCGDHLSNVRMGADTNRLEASGIYYVPVTKESPYVTSCYSI